MGNIRIIRNPGLHKQMQDEQRDTTAPLWEDLYKVIVPILATKSVDYIREAGVFVSGVPELDNDISSRTYVRYACVADMVDWFREGVPVRVCDYKQTKKIYEDISRHLNAWKKQLEFGLNNRNAPIEDLLAMDQFATKVYGHAVYVDNGHVNDDPISEYFSSFLEVSADRIFVAAQVKPSGNRVYVDNNGNTVIEPEAEAKIPERNTHEEFLKKQIMELNHW